MQIKVSVSKGSGFCQKYEQSGEYEKNLLSVRTSSGIQILYARNNIDMKIQAYANDGPGMYRIRTAGVQS